MSNIRTTLSHFSLISTTNNSERILHVQESFRTVSRHKNSRRGDKAVKELIHILDEKLESCDCKGSSRTPTIRAETTPAASNLNAESSHRFSEQLRCMVAQIVRRGCPTRSNEAMQGVVENALQNVSSLVLSRLRKRRKSIPWILQRHSNNYGREKNVEQSLWLQHRTLNAINPLHGDIYPPCTKVAARYATCGRLRNFTCGGSRQRKAHTVKFQSLAATGA